jgi:sirohydrochlorin cobaltochelatase
MGEKKAVLVVSFGTTYRETLEKNIAAIEQAVAAALPDRELRRAFTSGMVMARLKKRDGLVIHNVAEALDALAQEGFTDVVIQPTHIMNGDEYDKLCALAAPFAGRLRLRFGTPLLTELEDYRQLCRVLMEELPAPEDGEALVFMGHGTGHYANGAYAQLDYMLRDLGLRAFVGTVEGYPMLEEVLRRLEERPEIRRVCLCPLMIVAGDHATNDMAGDEEDSWKSCLERAGYGVRCHVAGLGELPGVRALFAAHAVAAAAEE